MDSALPLLNTVCTDVLFNNGDIHQAKREASVAVLLRKCKQRLVLFTPCLSLVDSASDNLVDISAVGGRGARSTAP